MPCISPISPAAGNSLRRAQNLTFFYKDARMVWIAFYKLHFSAPQVHLKSIMQTVGRGLVSPADMETLDMAVAVIANENVELATAFIQKKAVEKAGLGKNPG